MTMRTKLLLFFALASGILSLMPNLFINGQLNDVNWLLMKNYSIQFNPIQSNYTLSRKNNFFMLNPIFYSSSTGKLVAYGKMTNTGFVDPYYYMMSILDSSQSIMANGDSIRTSQCSDMLSLTSSDTNKFWIISNVCDFDTNTLAIFPPIGLLLNEIDYDSSLQKYRVSKKNIVLESDLSDGKLAACRHANGKDWWLVFLSQRKKSLVSLLFSEGLVLQRREVKLDYYTKHYNVLFRGQMSFSPDGKYLALVGQGGYVQLIPFNRNLGIFGRQIQLRKSSGPTFPTPNYYLYDIGTMVQGEDPVYQGCQFSPNSQFLYVTSRKQLYQYNLNLPLDSIAASRVTIHSFPYQDTTSRFMGLAIMPTGQLFVANSCFGFTGVGWSTNPYDTVLRYFHRIEHPNNLGLACDFRFRGDTLPDSCITYCTAPNLPNYRLGPSYSLDTVEIRAETVCPGKPQLLNSFAPPWCRVRWLGPGPQGWGSTLTWQMPDTTQWVTLVAEDTTSNWPARSVILRKRVIVSPSADPACKVNAVPFETVLNKFRIYPNPANETLNIGYENILEGTEVRLLNLLGVSIRTTTLTGKTGNLQWELGELPAGIYYLQIFKDETVIAGQKILISR
jgi:hypothetical protein